MAKNKYSDTVLLPKTNFPMRAGLTQKEPKILEFWEKLNLYNAVVKKHEGQPSFVLHDGPPYANGHIHIGHALDKTVKDLVVKSRAMSGKQVNYIPGWDCHGLPIEHALMKETGISKKDITEDKVAPFRQKAREFAGKYIGLQKEDFKRLGVMGDFENYYSTMAPRFEGTIITSFLDLVEKGYVHRGKKTVYWCPSCETALADAETEYADKTSTSIYVKFNLAQPLEGKKASLVVWTTTPWTMPANKAAAVSNTEKYVFLKTNGEYLIVADKLADAFLKETGLTAEKDGVIDGEKLVGLKYKHPLTGVENPVIWTDFVAMDTGVGIVHIAPGHGEDDFYAGLKWNLDIFCPVDEKGCFTKDGGEFAGQNIFDANQKVVEKLDSLGLLIKSAKIEHSYPHCWRCKNPVIFRATEQWFLGVDTQNLRGRVLDALKTVNWFPAAGVERIGSMVKNRPDWCLSRQRFWGTPITILYCKDCGETLTDPALFNHIKERAMKEGADFWFKESAAEIAPTGFKCKCGSQNFRKETDILDVWLDSGVSWRAVLKDRGVNFPADVYSEGSDQHRGWFQSSIIPSVALEGVSPFKNLLTHGFVLDHNGHAMHKSAGNTVSPQEVINKYGADILRLWVSLSDYTDDIRISDEILQGPIDSYRRFRNTVRYALGNLFDYDPANHKVAPADMTEMDRYMLGRLDTLIQEVAGHYEVFEFRKAVRAVLDFCILDLSSFMLDASKDRLYTLGSSHPSRRSAQTALSEILTTLLQLTAPALSFTCEEAWQEIRTLPMGVQLEESIFLSVFPKNSSVKTDKTLEEKWGRVRSLRESVLKTLEEARTAKTIGSSLEAKVIFKTSGTDNKKFIQENLSVMAEICIVSETVLTDGGENIEVAVEHADGEKCPRCWQWKKDIGSDAKYADVCVRCAEVLKKENIEVLL